MPDGHAGAASPIGGEAELPTWDLADLYPGPDSAELEADLDRAEKLAQDFAAAHAGKLAGLSGAALAAAIAGYEGIEEMLGRVMSYAQLLFSGDSNDPAIGRFYQSMNERVTAISSHLIFFTLELNRLDDAVLDQKLADPRSGALAALAAGSARVPPAPAVRRAGEAAAREGSDRPLRLVAPVRRDHRRAARAGERRGADGQRRAEQAVRPRPRGARGGGAGDRGGVQQEHPPVRADHQHAGQGQGDPRHLAPLPAPGQLSQPRQHGRGRGGGRAGQRRHRRLSAAVAPLLPI